MFFYEVHKWKADQLVSLRKSVGSQLEVVSVQRGLYFFSPSSSPPLSLPPYRALSVL